MGLGNFLIVAATLVSAKEALAQEVVQTKHTEKTWGLSLTASLSETPIESSSVDHYRQYGLALVTSFRPSFPTTSWLKDPLLSAKFSYVDEIGYEDNNSNFQNTKLSFTGVGFDFTDDLKLSSEFSSYLATNDDSRKYYGFVGSIKIAPALAYTTAIPGLTLSAGLGVSYSYYEFETNKGGVFNPESLYEVSFGIGYEIEPVTFNIGGSNSTVFLADGSKKDDIYSGHASITYSQTDQLSYGLSLSKEDRTYGYDGLTPNLNFTYADQSLVTASVTYSL
ncbi:hypothetical protein [Pseudobacteriovorax antillogorgiicola]|uniref:Uncharacterized protein n=1 Tax=Pseudobacteriovorax antillogorgiicola TaxID=1513793 RepID=A0A1Y6BF82_9BACT|nr:hypothetical protein [Pseudobacteriovorax antillogorgiicola]TCS56331.1 hypothetical protein EDD56_104153 [Pseudobacteriovorax antillogorgiicola]SMF06964.1 hypothetical protein SAMN06296036_104180 [Pseudobacteriovorax antillogorgiicola]